jgi:hypothetical protein
MTWPEEVQAVDAAATRYNIDPLFPLALRIAEGVHTPYPFGILDPKARSYLDRLNECCATIRNHLTTSPANPLTLAHSSLGVRRTAYNDIWIAAFGRVYAPIGADNDPRGLNRNWIANVTAEYNKLLAIGTDDPSWQTRWMQPPA